MKSKVLIVMALLGLAAFGWAVIGTPVLAEDKGARETSAVEAEDEGPEAEMAEIELMSRYLKVLQQLTEIASEPEQAGMLAIRTLQDDVEMAEKDKAKIFEDILPGTKSLTMRNAIRLALKESRGRPAREGCCDAQGNDQRERSRPGRR
ncbi:MAG: hypothetical protein GWP05_10165 [Anaerolineaceae bacterium]|nr:hypothetical protein [Anaerolineaceae bacterium]